MEFGGLSAMIPAAREKQHFDEWCSRLSAVCGSFRPEPFERGRAVTGTARVMSAGGLEFAHIANNVDLVRRTWRDIKNDYGENLFLLVQLEGSCGIEQREARSVMHPGDCILVDSSHPSTFHFHGDFSNHLSVHLPRQLLFSEGPAPLAVAQRLSANDPMAAMLRALSEKLMSTPQDHKRAPQLRELLFRAIHQTFSPEVAPGLSGLPKGSESRLDLAQMLIDQHLTAEYLSPQWLATKMGVSLRTLQSDFCLLGTTVNEAIRTRRIYFARDKLIHYQSAQSRVTIAEIAYASGFNDISYFNRSFKKIFNCSPRDLLQQSESAVMPTSGALQ